MCKGRQAREGRKEVKVKLTSVKEEGGVRGRKVRGNTCGRRQDRGEENERRSRNKENVKGNTFSSPQVS